MYENLTEMQKKVFACLLNEINNKGYPPSIREIGDTVGLRSSASVKYHLDILEDKGYILKDGKRSRAIKVLYNPNTDEFISRD